MNFQISIGRKHALIVAAAILIVGLAGVFAFGGSNPSVLGHSAGELIVDSTSITDGSIVNADISGAAAINGAKLAGDSVGATEINSVSLASECATITGSAALCDGNDQGGDGIGINGCSRQIGIGSGSGNVRTATCPSSMMIDPGCFNGNPASKLVGIHNTGLNTVDFIWDSDPGGIICDATCCNTA